MIEKERGQAPPFGGVFVAHARVLDSEDIQRAIQRMAHEIVERNHGLENVVLIGLQTGGVVVAEMLAEALKLHRDDIGMRPVMPEAVTDISVDLDGATIVIADDVLYTGRTIRAALDALCDFGRPREIQLAVMVDRGHRELPIRPDYVGKNLPTRKDEVVDVSSEGVDLGRIEK